MMITFRKSTTVQVILALASSSAPALGDGAVSWRIQIENPNAYHFRSAIADDGTVYTAGADELLALSPDGDVLWSAPAAVHGGPIVLGSDGTIYAGGFSEINAFNPDGSARWSYTAENTQGLIAGPAVGPDGNIYAVFDAFPDGIGVISLGSDGQLRWDNVGDPAVHQNGGGGREIVFGQQQMYVAFKAGQGTTPPALWAFDLGDGDQAFYLGSGCESVPTMSPGGDILVAIGACGITSYDQNGDFNWFAETPPGVPTDVLEFPAVAPDGTIYTAHSYWRFWALNPDGSTRWYIDDFDTFGLMKRLAVSPDNSVVLNLGGPDFGQPGWVQAYSTQDAALLWQIDLPVDPQGNVAASSLPIFTADAQRVYFSASVAGGDDYSFFYAIDLVEPAANAGDVDGDGVVGVMDMLALLAAWGDCPPAAGCPADVDGDDAVGVTDLLMLLANWT